MSLHKIPGVEIIGWVEVDKDLDHPDIETLMSKLGAIHLGENKDSHYFGFDVEPSTGELTAKFKTSMSKIYGYSDYEVGLMARWVG